MQGFGFGGSAHSQTLLGHQLTCDVAVGERRAEEREGGREEGRVAGRAREREGGERGRGKWVGGERKKRGAQRKVLATQNPNP